MHNNRKNIFKITEIGLVIAFISVFLYSEVGYVSIEKHFPQNDYCLIIKGADLHLSKTVSPTFFKLSLATAICFNDSEEQKPYNLNPMLNISNNYSPKKDTDIYLYDRVFMI